MKHRWGWMLLLLASLLRGTLGWAQSSEAVVNDLAFVLGGPALVGQTNSRSMVQDSLTAFTGRHRLYLLLNVLAEEQLYQDEAQRQADQLLQQTAPTLVITTWHEFDTKTLRRTQVQVNEALAARLSQATAEQIVTEWLAYWSDNTPIAEDALREGLLLALFKLDAYLNALPPAGQVPTITFANPVATTSAPPTLGLDAQRYPAHQGNYAQTEIKQADYPVAWKALPSGAPTTVLAQVDKEISFPAGLVFRQNDSSVPAQPGSELHQQQLTLTGQAHQQEGSLEVYASGDEDAELVGKLSTISYDVLPKNLVLISLDEAIVHDDAEMQQEVEDVKRIFAQANVQLEVITEGFRTDWGNRDVPLEDETSGMLSNYPKQLKQVIKDYRKTHEGEKETAYIFLAGESSSGRKGYMPKKRNYGFVFVHQHEARESLARTIAHELGHGWFNLKHSWQTYAVPGEGKTDNLMDYGAGTRLRKYQWDFVHDPISMLGWFQDEDDVSDYTKRTDMEWVVEIYSTKVSEDFVNAHKDSKHKTMKNWINWGLKENFTSDRLSALKSIDDALPRRKDGSVPVAIIKHYPKAKHKGLYVYHCKKVGVVVQAVKEPIVFTSDFPVDLSLYTGEFDDVGEKAAPMNEETVQAYTNLPYEFVWETMTEQGVVDKTSNYVKEVVDHPNVGRDEGTVRYLMDAIAKTAFGKSYTYPMEEKLVYMYDFKLGKNKVPLALHILEDEPSFKRNDLVELDLGGSEDRSYTVLAFCEDKDPTKAKVLVQVDEEYAEAVKDYFASDKEKLESEQAKRINNAIAEMQLHLGKEYEQESGGLRTENTKEGIEKMDCSEFVSRYLQKVTGAEDVPNYTTANLAVFTKKSSKLLEYVSRSDKKEFQDIQPGDIFLWRTEGVGGHTGVVTHFNKDKDQVTVMEAISRSGSREESFSISISGYCTNCLRKSVYSRTGDALYGHPGWKGYFRPKTKSE